MPLHLLMAAAKIHSFSATPLLATLIWPFCIKFMLSLRPIKDIVQSIAFDSNLLVFQLTRIFTSPQHRGRRLNRVFHLVGRVTARFLSSLTAHICAHSWTL
ncbi:hypothetical protein Ccrd_008210 [Cynara cardunculus var. scolymus]|uniref:Uncharacterized protein n=1 Tax=Cynara cardunculus var. scolymus TaxID=59895 RepID=A0A124SB79_CYNCS|nr:hypothetical protein Ccrd_008210 [Cynara cardunculus var. scolymus]